MPRINIPLGPVIEREKEKERKKREQEQRLPPAEDSENPWQKRTPSNKDEPEDPDKGGWKYQM